MKPQLTTIRKFADSLAFMELPVFTYIDRDDFAIIKIEELGMQLPFQTPAFRPDYFNIIAIPEGSAIYLVGDEMVELHSNHILFTRPDIFLSSQWFMVGKAFQISFSKHFLMQYWPAGIDEIQKLDVCKGYSTCLTEKIMEDVENICNDMYNEAVSQASYKYELITNLIINLLLLIRRQQYTNISNKSNEKYNAYVMNFLWDLEDNFSKIISGEAITLFRIKDYANRQNLNENYLSKIVSTTTGKTINQWIQEKLVSEIKYLLKYTDKPMRDIAAIYGFNDMNYFYNYFKRHTRNAPGLFRKDFHA